jgi:hypothetical protein
VFDRKYKTVLKFETPPDFPLMIDWVESNSNGLVSIKFLDGASKAYMFVGFENLDDALFFKIKFMV